VERRRATMPALSSVCWNSSRCLRKGA
jgi:hypothetical protein